MSVSEGPCPLCGREMIRGKSLNRHHLIPKTFKGKDQFLIHIVCHSKIHSVFTERELLHEYNTFDKLQAHPEIARFIEWVKRKPPEFRDRNEPTRAKRRR